MERLPGFRDFYPEPLPHQDVWSAEVRNYVFDTWRAVARRYGFREYDGPPLVSALSLACRRASCTFPAADPAAEFGCCSTPAFAAYLLA